MAAIHAKPEPGTLLIVIHDFQARSADELTLLKGDRVELIERDDEYGDGWYLGKHAGNGLSGLFPEVYTRPAPKTAPGTITPAAITLPRSAPPEQTSNAIPSPDATPNESRMSVPTPETDRQQHQANRHASASELRSPPVHSPPLASASVFKDQPASAGLPTTGSLSAVGAFSPVKHQHGQDSPVLNETLTVIQEHISDMNAPRYTNDRRGNDSGSEYSSHLDHRMSYINGEETDEEEDMFLTTAQVTAWTPDQVAAYLESVGVEAKHCDVFREQEISGEVLLGMDQTSVFLKEFELGSVGRRLKTWQKIKNLQDEVNNQTPSVTRRTTQTYGSDGASEDGRHSSLRGGPVRKPSIADRASTMNGRASVQKGRSDTITSVSPVSPKTGAEAPGSPAQPTRILHEKRPSAASVRDLHHSRRHSSTDFGSGSLSTKPTSESTVSSVGPEHKKQPSFDRNWTMNFAASTTTTSPGRPQSSAGFSKAPSLESKESAPAPPSISGPVDYDRGYFSGGEDGRKRNVLKKRDPSTHTRNSSYADEHRMRSATAQARHSRFGSMDSLRDRPTTPSASQKYYGLSARQSRKFGSTDSGRPVTATPQTGGSPIPRPERPDADVSNKSSPKSPERPERGPEWKLPGGFHDRFNLRAVSETSTPTTEKSVTTLTDTKDSPADSPSRTASSSQSAKGSLESDTADQTKSTVSIPSVSSRSRKKSKKETSAYTRGLEKKTPAESMKDCDYSGWMKKKSTNLMTTWKPRLFVLKGRRLSYYYSENDTEEKGLIDISFHRVLPADNDRLTGLHATLTGATSNPSSPSNFGTPTRAETDASNEPESTLSKGSGDQVFIFKLVPPRAGLSRAVTFTKPTVHYFAVPNIKQGRLWMAALMKATIDRDDSQPVSTTYQQKTISLAKARAMRHRPPALMNLDEKVEEEIKTPAVDLNGLNIQGIIFDDRDTNEGDSGVSGLSKADVKLDSPNPAEPHAQTSFEPHAV